MVEGPELAVQIAWPEGSPEEQVGSLFVFAKAPSGPPMPIAAVKLNRAAIANWPVNVRLNDANSPMPVRKLSQAELVVVTARWSPTGSANDASFEASSAVIQLPSEQTVELVLKAN